MNAAEFTLAIRERYVDGMEKIYGEMFSRPLDRFKDPAMLEMARFWQSTDSGTRAMLVKFMRLGSEASVASLLAALDNSSADFEEQFLLTARAPDGSVTELRHDLLDTFWTQAGKKGRNGTPDAT